MAESGALLASSDGGGGTTYYFWLDILVNNQWDTSARSFTWWSSAFKQNVKSIGHTLLVLSPWHDPVPLTRAWCLYELLCTEMTSSHLSIQLPFSEAQSFETALVNNFDEILSAFAMIDAEKSEAFNPRDRDMIFEAVRSHPGGFHNLNTIVLDRLRKWVLICAMKSLKRSRAQGEKGKGEGGEREGEERKKDGEERKTEGEGEGEREGGRERELSVATARLLHACARLLYLLADLPKAEVLEMEAFAEYKDIFGSEHPETLEALSLSLSLSSLSRLSLSPSLLLSFPFFPLFFSLLQLTFHSGHHAFGRNFVEERREEEG